MKSKFLLHSCLWLGVWNNKLASQVSLCVLNIAEFSGHAVIFNPQKLTCEASLLRKCFTRRNHCSPATKHLRVCDNLHYYAKFDINYDVPSSPNIARYVELNALTF